MHFRRRAFAALAAAALLAASIGLAQDRKAGTPAPFGAPTPGPTPMPGPKPPAEVEALAYFLGPWTSEGELKPGPMGPGGPTKGRELCRWMPGHFFLGCMMETQSPVGLMQVQGVLGWDPGKKTYLWWSFDNLGRAETATGTLKNGTWTWTGDSKMGEKIYKTRYTISDTRPDGYDFALESSADGKSWAPVMSGKSTKAIARPGATPMPGGVKPPAGTPVPAPAPTKTK